VHVTTVPEGKDGGTAPVAVEMPNTKPAATPAPAIRFHITLASTFPPLRTMPNATLGS
jgi:hypothetical protein